MHRMKIGLIAAGLLLLFTAIFYASTTSKAKDAAAADVEERVARAQHVYQHISRLGGLEMANLAAEKARRPGVVAAPEKGDETARRQAAFEECEVINAALGKDGRRADIVAILDGQGRVLARDLNPNADYGEDLRTKFPAVDAALKGQAVKDIWTWQNRIIEVGVAPITKSGGQVVGALLIGFVLSAKKAQERRELLGADLVYFHAGKVATSSFVSDASGKEDVARTQSMTPTLFQSPGLAEAALKAGRATAVQRIQVEGEEYAAVAAPFPGNFADRTGGVLLLASLSDGARRARQTGNAIAILGLLSIVIALGAAVFTARRFIAPLDQIELGVAEVINGNIDHTFKPVGPDFEGLSNSLNVMLARLLGRDEPNEDAVEDEGEPAKWRAEQMVIEESDGAPTPQVAALGQESEASYYPRLFNEYVNALRALGKPADGVSVQAFMAKLRLAEAGLRQKWSCRLVRFQIFARGDQPVFRAVRID